jgi:hypothetical protein
MVMLKTGVLWLRENPTIWTAERDGVTMTVARHGLSKWVPVVMFGNGSEVRGPVTETTFQDQGWAEQQAGG